MSKHHYKGNALKSRLAETQQKRKGKEK